MQNRNIEEEIEKTLSSLDKLERVEVPNFLYANVMAKMARKKKNETFSLTLLLTRPALSIAALFITAVLNIYMIVKVQDNSSSVENTNDASMQAFAKEYGIESYSAYDK